MRAEIPPALRLGSHCSRPYLPAALGRFPQGTFHWLLWTGPSRPPAGSLQQRGTLSANAWGTVPALLRKVTKN